ncbi:uncharacterized protein BP5553_01043 [Venustampulla echinocandica]|uniref:Rab proteins geranylgeranyltransferase n=1 Tax=Venustampulla echinocandica TaxID=2656787 RepID=A0A370TZW3_9HELO|nr:uncharacterized protein BP5553_01043 [Venustampulla echinocandica]RDL41064.1 hypothetical protein BP5553_01043 [Venustampulla echinocandica]
MESLSDTKWDVVISGTGLQHSLLALALSRSDKKILHVDHNEYYGGAEAAFSLQEVDEWHPDSSTGTFQNVTLWKDDADTSSQSNKLSFSRAYTLTLSPQIIYTKSKLLGQLVSSKVYRQLEFQAVGNWWIYNGEGPPLLKRLPNGREDIFRDQGIDNRAKRSLMKFLKFVVDFENQPELWEADSECSLQDFLSSRFQLPPHLQSIITALTLSLDTPGRTIVKWALPRISRHLTSIGVFGPGFGAVIPKWGGGAEIAQVACRAGAVGGGVYVLGTGVTNAVDDRDKERWRIELSNGETVGTKHYIPHSGSANGSNSRMVSKTIAVVSSTLSSLFVNSTEGSPLAAVSVVVFPSGTLHLEEATQDCPVYVMVHSSETGECPAGQCVLYATTLYSATSKPILDAALSSLIKSTECSDARLLYTLYYDQQEDISSPCDLAFDDRILENVEEQWKEAMGSEGADGSSLFMQFEERRGINPDDDNDDDY